MIIGGGIAFTFLKALGYSIGKSIVKDDLIPMAHEVMTKAKELGVKFYLPIDCVIAENKSAEAATKPVKATRSRISPQAAGLPSSSSKERSFPPSKPWNDANVIWIATTCVKGISFSSPRTRP